MPWARITALVPSTAPWVRIGPIARVDGGEEPLRLAEGIGADQAGAALGGVGGPPGVEVGGDIGLRAPGEHRQAEGAFGDEGVAADGLERLAEAVGLGLVVAGDDPDLARHLDADLRRAGDVAGGVEADRGGADPAGLAEGDALGGDLSQAVADHRQGGMGGEIGAVAGAGVVGMAVGDQRAVDRAPGVDEEVTRFAVEAAIGAGEDGRGHGREVSPQRRRSMGGDQWAAVNWAKVRVVPSPRSALSMPMSQGIG